MSLISDVVSPKVRGQYSGAIQALSIACDASIAAMAPEAAAVVGEAAAALATVAQGATGAAAFAADAAAVGASAASSAIGTVGGVLGVVSAAAPYVAIAAMAVGAVLGIVAAVEADDQARAQAYAAWLQAMTQANDGTSDPDVCAYVEPIGRGPNGAMRPRDLLVQPSAPSWRAVGPGPGSGYTDLRFALAALDSGCSVSYPFGWDGFHVRGAGVRGPAADPGLFARCREAIESGAPGSAALWPFYLDAVAQAFKRGDVDGVGASYLLACFLEWPAADGFFELVDGVTKPTNPQALATRAIKLLSPIVTGGSGASPYVVKTNPFAGPFGGWPAEILASGKPYPRAVVELLGLVGAWLEGPGRHPPLTASEAAALRKSVARPLLALRPSPAIVASLRRPGPPPARLVAAGVLGLSSAALAAQSSGVLGSWLSVLKGALR